MKNRSRTDIVANILQIVNESGNSYADSRTLNGRIGRNRHSSGTSRDGGANKTKIMYGAYLSYEQLKDYLALLLESGLLIQYSTNNQIYYRTTPKSWEFLKLYDTLGQMAGESNNDLEDDSNNNSIGSGYESYSNNNESNNNKRRGHSYVAPSFSSSKDAVIASPSIIKSPLSKNV